MKSYRYEKNPIIKIEDVIPSSEEMEVLGVFNPGVVSYNGKTVLLVRVAEKVKDAGNYVRVPIFDRKKGGIVILDFDKNDNSIDFSDVRFVKTLNQKYLTSMSHIRIATSDNGIDFKIEREAFIKPTEWYEEFGVEDPRITFIDGEYYINYSAISRNGVVTALAKTKDFKSVEKLGIVFLADNKDVVIFPEKIGGKYVALHRPTSAHFNRPQIWIGYGDKITAYSDFDLICDIRPDCFDSARVGAGCVPFLTEKGWLEIYHGATADDVYCLGALLLDKDNPTKVLAKSNKPIFESLEQYELNGFMPSVVFACGCIVDGDDIHMYYGNCDENICYAKLSVKEILKTLAV